MRNWQRAALVVVVFAIAAGALVAFAQQVRHGRSRGADAEGAVPVVAATPRSTDVPVYLEGVGTVQAYNMVTVHTQVDGQLIRLAFEPVVTTGFSRLSDGSRVRTSSPDDGARPEHSRP